MALCRQRGLWTLVPKLTAQVIKENGLRHSLAFNFMEWDKGLCHQIMWVKCFEITRWKASYKIQSVTWLLQSTEIIVTLSHMGNVRLSWLLIGQCRNKLLNWEEKDQPLWLTQFLRESSSPFSSRTVLTRCFHGLFQQTRNSAFASSGL